VAYYRTSKFSSYEIRYIFWLFLIARPIIVGLYHAFQMCMTNHKVIYFYKDQRKQRQELAKINTEIEVELAL